MKNTFLILFVLLILSTINTSEIPAGMVIIPGGSCTIGIDSEDLEAIIEMGADVPKMKMNAEWWYSDEIPIHLIEVDSFFMDATEVTYSQFAEFVENTGYQAEGEWQKYHNKKRLDHPVVNVTFNDAIAYANWAGKRLPTEQEWEYAAKGGQNVKWFPWGNDADTDGSKANYNYKGEGFWGATWRLIFPKIKTTPVGNYDPNPFGLYDMCGNVSEFTSSIHKPYPNGPEDDFIYARHGYYSDNPKPVHGIVHRGGSWEGSNPVHVRLNGRSGVNPSSYNWNRGFRCVRSLKEDPEEEGGVN